MIKVSFNYTDEFNQVSEMSKTYDNTVLEISSPFEILVEEFKLFLLGAGYSQKLVDTIALLDLPED
jgi:hypothetical protein